MSEANDELSVLREHLERYRAVTLQTLDLTPEEKLDWHPAEKSMSCGEQFLHIARTEEYFAGGFFGGVWRSDLLSENPGTLSKQLLRERLERSRSYLRAQLETLDPARLADPVRVPNVPVEWPLRGWLWYLLEHELHHKAQLAVYLRQLGVVPPFFALAFPPGVRPDIR